MKSLQTLENVEYKIKDIIKLLFLNKKVIFVSTIIFLLIGLLTSIYFFSNKKIHLTVNPKSNDYMVDFLILNQLKKPLNYKIRKHIDGSMNDEKFAFSFGELKQELKYNFEINRVKLLVKFSESLYDEEIIKEAFLENSYNLKNEDKTPEKIDKLVSSMISNLSYKRENKENYLILNLTLKTNNVKKDIKVLNAIISKLSKKVGKLQVERFNRFKNHLKIKNSLEIKELEKELEILTKKTEILKNKRLIFLTEQYNIAKNLEIPKRTIPYFSNDEYYLKGYLSILEEINILNNKSNESILNSSPEFIKINNALLDAKSGIELKLFQNAFNETPFANGDLSVISYDGKYSINYIINPFIIIISFTLIGFLLSMFTVLIINIYKTNK